jgi:hypothetical protein
MKFDPVSRNLLTDNNEFIKTLSCTFVVDWDLLEVENKSTRKCGSCNYSVTDTEVLSDTDKSSLRRLMSYSNGFTI